MKASSVLVSVALVGVLMIQAAFAQADQSVEARRVSVVLAPGADAAERAVAEHLRRRLLQVSAVDIHIGEAAAADADLNIYLGRLRLFGLMHLLFAEQDMTLPAREAVFPEGYAVKAVLGEDAATIIAGGADDRGVLYAAGEIVRQLRFGQDHVRVFPFHTSAAPAFRYRGFSANQGGTMRSVTGARAWTQEEHQDVVLEYALAGANTFYAGGPLFDFVKNFGLLTVTGARPNQLRGEFPPEWKAHGREAWEGPQWVCPSIPEARAALMRQWEADFAQRPAYDVMRFYAGDPGGCTCDQCTPWGKTFIEFSEEMAAVWLRHHPESTIQAANQGLDNAGDAAIFAYYREQPRAWSYGICYGPGSNAMSRYFRDIDLRDDLFVYSGHGPVNRYLAEILNQLPPDQKIVHYSDITHYISAQFAAEHPDRNLVKSYGRRTFHARPKGLYRIFQQIMPFSEGDIIYSEGNHDEFHQYLWNRLLFHPNRDLEDIMLEYCTLYFGEEAAPLMVAALHQLEFNLEAPLAENEGIARYHALVQEAGAKMPPWRLARDHRWHLHLQKAVLDLYLQHKLRIELDKERRVQAIIEAARTSANHREDLARAIAILQEPGETEVMAQLRAEADRLGAETDARHGDRNPGFFRLDQSLRDLHLLEEFLRRAARADVERAGPHLDAALQNIAAQTNPGRIFW